MEFVRTIVINIGDIIECLTSDGWESGVVTNVTEDKITVNLYFISEVRDFGIDEIRLKSQSGGGMVDAMNKG